MEWSYGPLVISLVTLGPLCSLVICLNILKGCTPEKEDRPDQKEWMDSKFGSSPVCGDPHFQVLS